MLTQQHMRNAGIPVATLLLLLKNRDRLQEPRTTATYGFLYHQFKYSRFHQLPHQAQPPACSALPACAGCDEPTDVASPSHMLMGGAACCREGFFWWTVVDQLRLLILVIIVVFGR